MMCCAQVAVAATAVQVQCVHGRMMCCAQVAVAATAVPSSTHVGTQELAAAACAQVGMYLQVGVLECLRMD